MKRRVVITGMGAVTPIGNTIEEFWDGIRSGKSGIAPITHFDASEYKVKLAAEVKNFVAKERMDFKAAKRMESFSQYAVAAAKEAFEDAGLDMAEEDPYRIGTIIGSGIGGLECHEKNYKKLQERGPGRVNPLMIPLMISNMAAGNVSIQLGLKGKCTDVVTACASGANSIGDAMRAIQYGDLDVCVAGGTEASICPSGVAGFTALTALSCNPDPASASRPFDKDIETQAGDVSAFVPTNVISITDGQIFLESNLFNSGIRPAVNPGISVSRVGGSAQTKVVKKLAGGIRTALAQYRELAAFAQFASDLDDATRKQLSHGEKVTELLKQKQYVPLSVAEQSVLLFAVEFGYLEDVELQKIASFEAALLDYARRNHSEFMAELTKTGNYNDEVKASLKAILDNFKANSAW